MSEELFHLFQQDATTMKGKTMMQNLWQTAKGFPCHLSRHFGQSALIIPGARFVDILSFLQ
jgi:hypothetical protein